MAANIDSMIEASADSPTSRKIIVWSGIALCTYGILLAVGVVGSGFKLAAGGAEGARDLFAFATNPFLGLILGTMATALIQSSSTVTSVIVGLVAGGLPVSIAIPMIMGANIGTTVTNTLVSLGHAADKEEFKRAFSAATVHDFFNFMAVAIFLPLEIIFGFLEKTSALISTYLTGTGSLAIGGFNFIKPITKPVIGIIQSGLSFLGSTWQGVAMAIIGVGLIFVAITVIGKLLKRVMVGRAKQILHGAIGRGPITGITSGTIVTFIVQSSSTTTSLTIPLAGSGVLSVKDIYPFTLGANIGTCLTAILAATAVSGPMGVFALQIATVHFMFNLLGVIFIYGLPFTRNIPLKASAWLADLATERKFLAIGYILFLFFLLPGILVAISQLL